MADTNELRMTPGEVIEATKQLDALAQRVERLIATEAPNLTVTAPGRDEVSQRVASTFNDVHGAFGRSAGLGVTEIREIAATLRAHTDHVVAAEQEFQA